MANRRNRCLSAARIVTTQRHSYRPRLEALEDRTLPATLVLLDPILLSTTGALTPHGGMAQVSGNAAGQLDQAGLNGGIFDGKLNAIFPGIPANLAGGALQLATRLNGVAPPGLSSFSLALSGAITNQLGGTPSITVDSGPFSALYDAGAGPAALLSGDLSALLPGGGATGPNVMFHTFVGATFRIALALSASGTASGSDGTSAAYSMMAATGPDPSVGSFITFRIEPTGSEKIGAPVGVNLLAEVPTFISSLAPNQARFFQLELQLGVFDLPKSPGHPQHPGHHPHAGHHPHPNHHPHHGRHS
jgi:hypothetical protein